MKLMSSRIAYECASPASVTLDESLSSRHFL